MNIIVVALLTIIAVAMILEKPVKIVIVKQDEAPARPTPSYDDIEQFNKEQKEFRNTVASAIQNAMGVMQDD